MALMLFCSEKAWTEGSSWVTTGLLKEADLIVTFPVMQGSMDMSTQPLG